MLFSLHYKREHFWTVENHSPSISDTLSKVYDVFLLLSPAELETTSAVNCTGDLFIESIPGQLLYWTFSKTLTLVYFPFFFSF